MSEEEERIDKVIEDYEQTIEELYNELDKYRELYNEKKEKIDRLQKELDKKDKVINLIAKSWKQDDVRSVEEIKEYFYKQVEVEDE